MDFQDYPWVFPPPGFIRVDRNGTQSINPGQTVVVETISLDLGLAGWIVLAGIELSTYGTDANPAFFQLLQGGQIIRDYGRVRVPLGSPDTPAALHIKLYDSQPLTLSITNATNPTLTCAARWRLYGWFYQQ